MRAERAASLLGETQLFGGLDAATLEVVAERAISRRYDKGDFVFHAGDPGEALFVVAEGLVKVFVTSEEGEEMVLATLEPPQSFGELAIIDGGPRTASAKVMEPAVLLALTRATFAEILTNNRALVEALHASLGALLRRVLEQASDLVFLDLPGRVAKLLLRLAEERGERQDEGLLLDLKVSQSNLAAMVGGARPSVNQILRSLESRGYIEMRGRSILILDLERLRNRAGLA